MPDIKHYEVMIVIMTPGVTAGASGWGFVNGKLVHIPGNNPEAYKSLSAGVQAQQLAGQIKDAGLRTQLENFAAKSIGEGHAALQNAGAREAGA